MNSILRPFLLICLLLAGCAGSDRIPPHLRAKTLDHTLVPEHLDQPKFVELMQIPDVVDVRGLAGQRIRVAPPEPIGVGVEIDQIVIRRLGEESWVFVDLPPAMVWPKVQAFWSTRDLQVLRANPSLGRLDTVPAKGEGSDPESLWESLATGTGEGHQFRIFIEPGVRSGSTEIRLLERLTPSPEAAWPAASENRELEYLVLSKLAYYLGDVINQNIEISAGALNLVSAGRAQFVPDREKPVLKYQLDFDRTWATVGNALDSAAIEVADLNRSLAVYYVRFAEKSAKRGGKKKRKKKKDKDEEEEDAANQLEIRLETVGAEVHVTVLREMPEPVSVELAERLLKIIKEYSS